MKTSKQLRDELDAEITDYLVEEGGFEDYAMRLPGINQWVPSPVGGNKTPIWAIIPYLNDHKGWSREKIADWLDSLHDEGTADLSFDIKETE